jgi:altronate dehydratase
MIRYTQSWENGPADDVKADRYSEALIDVKQEMMEVLTKDIRTTNVNKLALRYVKTNSFGISKIDSYPVAEFINDYGTDKGPMEALMAVLAKSDCALVQAYRVAIAERFIDLWADEVAELAA